MPDIQLNVEAIVATGTAGTTTPAAGTSEVWTVAALDAGIPALTLGQTYALVDSSAAAGSAAAAELIRATACTGPTSTSLTVTRGADSTPVAAHATGATYSLVVVASRLNRGMSGAPDYAPERLANRYNDMRGCHNWKGPNTRIADHGIGNAMTGGQSRHVVIGDSASQGAITAVGVNTFDRARCWPYAMRDQFALSGVPTNGTGFVRINDNNLGFVQWTTNGVTYGWTGVTGTWTLANIFYALATSAGATGTFIADKAGSIVEVHYRDSGSATFTVSVDGATSGTGFATVTTGSSTTTFKKVKLTGLNVKQGSSIKLTVTTAGTGFAPTGVAVFSPDKGLIVDVLAQSGSFAYGPGPGDSRSWADTTIQAAFKDVAGRARSVAGTSVSGSPTFTLTTGTATADDVGLPIDEFPDTAGRMYPANTYIAAFVDGTHVTMSNNAIQTQATPRPANFGRDPSCLHIEVGGNDETNIATYGGLATSLANVRATITTWRNLFPNSNCVIHLVQEVAPSLATAATVLAFQQMYFQLGEDLDVPVFDWRDRTGTYAQALANGDMGDYGVHLTPGAYASIGCGLADLFGGGSGNPQNHRDPVVDGDLTNKRYTDAKDFAPVPPWNQDGTLTVRAGTRKWVNTTGRTVTVKAITVFCVTAPTGASIIVDVNKNGTTMYTTQANRPTIPAGSTAVITATLPDVLTLAAGDYMTVDIDQIGSTVAGADLTVQPTLLVS